jgi:hypothetical protein
MEIENRNNSNSNSFLTRNDLNIPFEIHNVDENCSRNGDWYDSSGQIRGKACPLSGLRIHISGTKASDNILTDSGDSILMSDGYCYNKNFFIAFIKSKIMDGNQLDNIISPMTRVPYPQDEISNFNSIVDLDFLIEGGEQFNHRCEVSYDKMIQPDFYYSFNNLDNNPMAQNMFLLYWVNKYIVSKNIDIKYSIEQNISSYFQNLSLTNRGNVDQLKSFFYAQDKYLPFIKFNKSYEQLIIQGDIIVVEDENGDFDSDNSDFKFIWENHPFFNPKFRSIFMTITKDPISSQLITNEMVFRNGSTKEYSVIHAPHHSTFLILGRKTKALMDSLKVAAAAATATATATAQRRPTPVTLQLSSTPSLPAPNNSAGHFDITDDDMAGGSRKRSKRSKSKKIKSKKIKSKKIKSKKIKSKKIKRCKKRCKKSIRNR